MPDVEKTVDKSWDKAAEIVLEGNSDLWQRLADIGASNNTSLNIEDPYPTPL